MSENRLLLVALGVVGALILGILGYYIFSGTPETPVTEQIELPQPTPGSEQVPTPVAVRPDFVPEEPKADSEPGFVLPRLDDSDQLVRDGVISLTRHEGVNPWLGNSELIRKFVVVVDNVGNGSIPKQHIGFMAPDRPFVATQLSDDVFVMNEASYRRYDRATDILVSFDSARAVEFYVLLRPLFQGAFDELGYGEAEFDDAIFKAIGRLLETPVLTEPVRLRQPVVAFEYEDRRLEALSSAQKQLLRTGPRNARLLQAKLSEVALELRAVLREGQ